MAQSGTCVECPCGLTTGSSTFCATEAPRRNLCPQASRSGSSGRPGHCTPPTSPPGLAPDRRGGQGPCPSARRASLKGGRASGESTNPRRSPAAGTFNCEFTYGTLVIGGVGGGGGGGVGGVGGGGGSGGDSGGGGRGGTWWPWWHLVMAVIVVIVVVRGLFFSKRTTLSEVVLCACANASTTSGCVLNPHMKSDWSVDGELANAVVVLVDSRQKWSTVVEI
mmetsp:Transcript_48180/g.134698  ORF Transcript_48180/g.134698 Transcript_48180/m.134698 type:complete len:222 (+) Transcript_48180:804-1469(+)